MAAPGRTSQTRTTSAATAFCMWWRFLEGEGQRLLQQLAHAREELSAVGTVEDAVIADQRKRHLVARNHPSSLVHRGPLLERAHRQEPRLRRVDDRRELPDAVHPEIRDREGPARHLRRRDLPV